MVGLANKKFRHSPDTHSRRGICIVKCRLALAVISIGLFAHPPVAQGQVVHAASDGGWGKATSEPVIRQISGQGNQDLARARPLIAATDDRFGDQKASSAFEDKPAFLQPASQSAALVPQPQPQPKRPISPEQIIRNRQLGDLKPGADVTVVRDSLIQPVVNTVVTIPQDDLPVPNQPQPSLVPPPSSDAVHQPAVTAELAPSYYEPIYSGHCNCPACRQNQAANWISLEALVWWTSDVSVPPLVTTSPNGTAPNLAGVQGPNSDVLFGGDDLFGSAQGGFRARYGHWNDVDEVSGFELEYMMLFSKGDNFYGRSDGNLILARPFTNVAAGTPTGGMQDSQIVAYPGLNSGTISVNAETRMYGIGAQYMHEIYLEQDETDDCGEVFGQRCKENPNSKVYLTLGPRFYHLDDTIQIRENFTSTASGNDYLLVDSFKTENSFLGGEIGLKARRRKGRLQADLGLSLGIGATRQELDIAGYSRVRSRNGGTEYANGFLAQPTNIGNYEETVFSLVPRLEFDLQWEFANGWSATVGYNLLYWTNVLRAGEQIDDTLNADLLPPAVPGNTGGSRPSANLDEADYLAHGISFGIERRF